MFQEKCVKEMQVLRREAAAKRKHESQQLEEFEFYKVGLSAAY